MKRLFKKRGQSVMEYLIVLSVVLAGILAIGFITKIHGTFSSYFTKSTNQITK